MLDQHLLLLTARRVHPDLQKLLENSLALKRIKYEKVYYEDGEAAISRKLNLSSAVLCAPGRWLSTSLIKSNKHIKLYQLWSSGFDKFNHKACNDCSIKFNTNCGNNAQSVAEHTLLLMLAASKKVPEMHMRTTEGKWSGNCNGSDMYLLNGKTLFIIGLGNIGKKVMKFASSFGMNIVYHDLIRSHDAEMHGAKYLELDDGLRAADYISLHLHLNQDTQGIINKKNLHLIKDSCFLVNVSRAELVEPAALNEIVQKNLLRGLAFDVYYSEPTNGSEEFLAYHNSIFTPHIAGSTRETIVQCIDYCVANLERALLGVKFDSVN
jgi:phosphoglycerate dehydrogenase-like enzyme